MYLIENVVTESDHIHNYTIEVRQRKLDCITVQWLYDLAW